MRKIIETTLIGFIAIAVVSGCGSPETKEESKASSTDITQQKLKAERTFVQLAGDDLENLSQGSSFTLTSEETNSPINLSFQVTRKQETMPGITSITAQTINEANGQAALLIRGGKLSGRIDLFSANKRYRLAYDTTRESHFLEIVIPDSLDELEGSSPMTPKREEMDY
ncbi:MAG: hypothetical protein RI564_00800 [Gracilimonas sp.]|nr:hypothetical protein [Gracilimonas sp.]